MEAEDGARQEWEQRSGGGGSGYRFSLPPLTELDDVFVDLAFHPALISLLSHVVGDPSQLHSDDAVDSRYHGTMRLNGGMSGLVVAPNPLGYTQWHHVRPCLPSPWPIGILRRPQSMFGRSCRIIRRPRAFQTHPTGTSRSSWRCGTSLPTAGPRRSSRGRTGCLAASCKGRSRGRGCCGGATGAMTRVQTRSTGIRSARWRCTRASGRRPPTRCRWCDAQAPHRSCRVV